MEIGANTDVWTIDNPDILFHSNDKVHKAEIATVR